MLKRTLAAAALVAVVATPAFAQQQPQMSKPDAAKSTMSDKSATSGKATAAQMNKSDHVNFIHQQSATDWRGSKLIGANIYGPDTKSIGDVNDVLIASDGNIRAVVVGVGGFLGVGEKNVALPFDALRITRKANSDKIDKISVSYTKDQLKNAPKFAYFDASKSETTGSNAMAPNRRPSDTDTVKK
jgi:sporulation protein YlmC with PRC-barrel domain